MSAAGRPRGWVVVVALACFGLVITGGACLGRTQRLPQTQASPSQPQRLLFSDEFSGTRLDSSKWGTCYPWFESTGCTNEGNPELEWYLPEQVTVGGGALHLTAVRNPVVGVDDHGRAKRFDYRSGMVTTARHFEFTYGRVEFKARAPLGRGLWPTLWLLPTDESPTPEIDIMEAWDEDPWHVALLYHGSPSYVPSQWAAVNDISRGWHTYTLDWSPGALIWSVDGDQVFRVDSGVPSTPMYLVANLAVSGDPVHAPDASTPATASLDIASVRVWALSS